MRACTRTVDEMGVRIDELENSIGELMAQVRPCPQPGTSFFSCPTSHHPALLTCSCARVLHDRRRASTRSRSRTVRRHRASSCRPAAERAGSRTACSRAHTVSRERAATCWAAMAPRASAQAFMRLVWTLSGTETTENFTHDIKHVTCAARAPLRPYSDPRLSVSPDTRGSYMFAPAHVGVRAPRARRRTHLPGGAAPRPPSRVRCDATIKGEKRLWRNGGMPAALVRLASRTALPAAAESIIVGHRASCAPPGACSQCTSGASARRTSAGWPC